MATIPGSYGFNLEEELLTQFQRVDINDIEYEFYSNPVSQAGSWIDMTGPPDEKKKAASLPALNDPMVRRQLSKQKIHAPWFLGTVSVIQILLLGLEFFLNWQATGQVLQTDPFNYMIGPAPGTLIKMGARFLPCMKSNTGYDTPGTTFVCPNGIMGSNNTCNLEETCAMPLWMFSAAAPNQWYRFISSIFLHGGVVHLLLNLSFQINVGFQMEREVGWWRIALIYFAGGAGGFIFGAPLSDIRIPTVGSSGALYGTKMFLYRNGSMSCARFVPKLEAYQKPLGRISENTWSSYLFISHRHVIS